MNRLIFVFLLTARLMTAETLVPAESGVPADLGGDVRIEQRGAYLLLTARMPEPGGKVLARSMGRNPVWEKDALAAPELEDRVRWRIRCNQRWFEIEVNPWGAYRVNADIEIRRSAAVTADGWTVQASLPIAALDPAGTATSIEWSALRIRSRRALAPEFQWKWPASSAGARLDLARSAPGEPPQFPALATGNTDPPLEIGRVAAIPAMTADWNDRAWHDIPSFGLRRNEPDPRSPKYRIELKWGHDGHTLALLARLEEPDPVVARAGGRDAALAGDDHLAIYLATSGSAFLEIVVNSVGAIRDALGTGPHMSQPRTSWNAKIETLTTIAHGQWIARINIPLDECAAALGEREIPKQWRMLLVRHRAARPGDPGEWSTLPSLDGTSTFFRPARYRAAVLSEELPARVKTAELPPAAFDAQVWTPQYRRSHNGRTMVRGLPRKRVEQGVLTERQEWDKVQTRQEWERFRDEGSHGSRLQPACFLRTAAGCTSYGAA